MKRNLIGFAMALLLVATSAFAQQRHDSAVFLMDVSETMGCKDHLAQAQKIARSMNQKFPNYVLSAGAEVFGNMYYPQIDWIAPVQNYDRAGLDQALAGLKKGEGATPMGMAIRESGTGLEKAQGKKALIIIGDGLDTGFACPVAEVKALKEKYHSDLCVFTIQIGDNPRGEKIMSRLVSAGECGKTTKASELQSDAGVQALVDIIFPPEAKVVVVPPPPPPKVIGDQDQDGVPDNIDQCPNTPRGAKVNAVGCWVIPDLRFEFDKWNILPQYTAGLDDAIQVMKNNPGLQILIEGHTDSVGKDDYNMTLSLKRAEAVRDYMVAHGIDASRLSVKGFGKTKPIATNDTDAGRAQNRRVQLSVIQ